MVFPEYVGLVCVRSRNRASSALTCSPDVPVPTAALQVRYGQHQTLSSHDPRPVITGGQSHQTPAAGRYSALRRKVGWQSGRATHRRPRARSDRNRSRVHWRPVATCEGFILAAKSESEYAAVEVSWLALDRRPLPVAEPQFPNHTFGGLVLRMNDPEHLARVLSGGEIDEGGTRLSGVALTSSSRRQPVTQGAADNASAESGLTPPKYVGSARRAARDRPRPGSGRAIPGPVGARPGTGRFGPTAMLWPPQERAVEFDAAGREAMGVPDPCRFA